MNGQQILVLPEGAMRTKGKDATSTNIAAAKSVADAIRTTLGPMGMDKMLVDSLGDVVISNDGATILDEMQIVHPAAKMMVEVAKTQDEEVGDGTTTAVVIAGELLKKAGELLDDNIHPTVITKGFRNAKNKALSILSNFGIPITSENKDILLQIANTAMTGKSAERASDKLSRLAVEAAMKVITNNVVQTDNIRIEKKSGGEISDTKLIEGVIIDREIVNPNMPKEVKNARIAMLESAIEVRELEGDTRKNVSAPGQVQQMLEEQDNMLREIVEKVAATGANVVLSQKGIDEMAQHFLAKKNILAIRRVKKDEMEALARATGGKVSTVTEISKEDLGTAGVVYEKKISGDGLVFVENCKSPKVVTILIRGGTDHVIDEISRAVEDAVRGIASSLEMSRVVPGGGATEMHLSRELKSYSETLSGREQLAVKAFADAMEIIPRSLAENAGLDPIDKLTMLRAEHEKKNIVGLDVFSGEVADMAELGVVEPLKTKTQALNSASEVAEMILRIDDVISTNTHEHAPPEGV